MLDLFTDPIFWGALMALLGVIVGQVVSGWGKKKDYDLSAVQATVEVLRAEYNRLNSEVKELRLEISESGKRYRKITEKYSAALAWIVSSRVWFTSVAQDLEKHGNTTRLPPIPDLIISDIPTSPMDQG